MNHIFLASPQRAIDRTQRKDQGSCPSYIALLMLQTKI